VLSKHNINNSEIISNPFITLKSVKDVKLRNVQYKILHNIYPTMKHLNRWKIKESDKCAYCDVTETLSHAIYFCPVAKKAIECLEVYLLSNCGYNVRFSYENLLLGVMNTNVNVLLNKKNERDNRHSTNFAKTEAYTSKRE
jgi:hypothetical protein